MIYRAIAVRIYLSRPLWAKSARFFPFNYLFTNLTIILNYLSFYWFVMVQILFIRKITECEADKNYSSPSTPTLSACQVQKIVKSSKLLIFYTKDREVESMAMLRFWILSLTCYLWRKKLDGTYILYKIALMRVSPLIFFFNLLLFPMDNPGDFFCSLLYVCAGFCTPLHCLE